MAKQSSAHECPEWVADWVEGVIGVGAALADEARRVGAVVCGAQCPSTWRTGEVELGSDGVPHGEVHKRLLAAVKEWEELVG